MKKFIIIAITINTILGLLFISSNFSIWYDISSSYPTVTAFQWSPILITAPHYVILDDGIAMVQRIYSYINLPFWIFFVQMAVNLFFIVWLARNKPPTTKQ
ncbi:MAG: hypothetical protein ACQCN3_12885 [Candidatus Bathyarchaeia archaeon]